MINKNFLVKFYKNKKKNPWLRPIFAFTIVGAKWLNFCVRDGNRCTSLAIVTKKSYLSSLKT